MAPLLPRSDERWTVGRISRRPRLVAALFLLSAWIGFAPLPAAAETGGGAEAGRAAKDVAIHVWEATSLADLPEFPPREPIAAQDLPPLLQRLQRSPARSGLAADGVTQLWIGVRTPGPGRIAVRWHSAAEKRPSEDRAVESPDRSNEGTSPAIGDTSSRPRGQGSAGRLRSLLATGPRHEPTPAGAATDVEASAEAVGGQYWGLFALTAPGEFADSRHENVGDLANPGRNRQILVLEVRFTPEAVSALGSGGATDLPAADLSDGLFLLSLELWRPPVVLVHGTYHNPQVAWRTSPPAEIGDASMYDFLTARGFHVYLCDYEKSNGKRYHGPSRFRDNQKVVWENPGGIREALLDYRSRGIAVTQADVVGHSLGGLLARVYARGVPLPEPGAGQVAPNPPQDPSLQRAEKQDEAPTDWYRRPDNFGHGDIRRLITLCSPHGGSDLVRLLRLYPEACRQAAAEGGERALSLLQVIDLIHGLGAGAFDDQAPGSAALAAIGPTAVPSHAIACVAQPDDFAHYNQRYRWAYLCTYLLAPVRVLEALFTHPDVRQHDDAEALVEFAARHQHLMAGLAANALAAQFGRPLPRLEDPVLLSQYNRALQLFVQAVFRGHEHDGTVSLPSAWGGLENPRARTRIEHVLHSFAARYPAVQEKVAELLAGPSDRFDANGFPPAGRELEIGARP